MIRLAVTEGNQVGAHWCMPGMGLSVSILPLLAIIDLTGRNMSPYSEIYGENDHDKPLL